MVESNPSKIIHTYNTNIDKIHSNAFLTNGTPGHILIFSLQQTEVSNKVSYIGFYELQYIVRSFSFQSNEFDGFTYQVRGKFHLKVEFFCPCKNT